MKKIAYLIFLLISACTHDKKSATIDKNDDDKAGPVIQPGAYPLATGHMWIYDNGDTIKAVSDTTINGIYATKLVKTNGNYKAAVYCANMTEGLCIVATNWKRFFNTFTYPYSPEDTISSTLIIPDAPILMEQLPVDNSSWTVQVPTYVNYHRQWMGYVTTTTPAGTFDCVKLRTDAHYEYYSSKGLVKTEDIITCITAPCPLPKTKLVYINF